MASRRVDLPVPFSPAEIYRSAQAGSQFVLATHSPILLAIPGAVLLSFDDGAIHPCAYEETGSCRGSAYSISLVATL